MTPEDIFDLADEERHRARDDRGEVLLADVAEFTVRRERR
jgi:hypothetical protein